MQEIILQQNYMGDGRGIYVNLHLSCGVLLTYLLTYLPTQYLPKLSQHYDGDVDVMSNLSFAYFCAYCKIVAAFILFYFIAAVCKSSINAAVYFIAALHLFLMNP